MTRPCGCRRSEIAEYETLMDQKDVVVLRRKGMTAFAVVSISLSLSLSLLFGCCLLYSRLSLHTLSQTAAPIPPDHTIPTLLSVVDHTTGFYINALDNPLYEQLKTMKIATEATTMTTTIMTIMTIITTTMTTPPPATTTRRRWTKNPPVLSLDRNVVGFREPLELSWTFGMTGSFFGTPSIQDQDIIALYCPHDGNHMLDAATVAQVKATHQRHGGTNENSWLIPQFPIFRDTTCQFRWIDATTQKVMATSPTIQLPTAPKMPHSIHLAYSHLPSELLVHFITGEPGTPFAMITRGRNTTRFTGISHTYTADALCQAPANVQEVGKFLSPGYLHEVRLTGLQLDTTYNYKVGIQSGQGIVWSHSFSFQSAPAVGDQTPFSYVVYGDQGCPIVGWGNGGLWTSAMAAREKDIRAVHHFGDLSYARGAAHIWDEWLQMLQPFSTHVPLMIGVGNHEYDHTSGGTHRDPSGVKEDHGFMPEWGNFFNDSGGECGVPTSQRFTMPASKNSNGVFWYSHDYATVHTIMISSEHNLTQGSPQYEWLQADLEATNRTLTPWIVVESHRPMYESEMQWDNIAVSLGMRYEIEDLLYDHHVDLVLSGHYHAYLRSCDGLYQSRCHVGGPTHITVGSAGAHLDENATLYSQEWTVTFIPMEYGYGRITVVNASAMHWEFLRAGSENDTKAGIVLDHTWIIRERY